MQRRTVRAAGMSVALHVAIASAVLSIRPHAGEGPSRLSIIDAELVLDAGLSRASSDGPEDAAGATAANAVDEPERADPAPADERAADAAVAEAPQPAAAEAVEEPSPTEPDSAIEQVELASREPPPEPKAAADVADAREVPDSADVADARDTADETADVADAADVAGAADAGDVPVEPDPGSSDPAVASADAALEPPPTPVAPGVPIEPRERAMIAKRFASWNGRFSTEDGPPTVDWKQDGRAYTAVFRAPGATDPMGLPRVVVDVSTEQGGKRISTQLTMTRLAFSNFAQFVDKWDPNVQIHDDVIDGRFHSNTPINLLSTGRTSPLFLGKVTIASHELETGSGGPFNRRKVFPEGVDTNVRRIVLPSRFLTLINEAAADEAAVQRFERDARIRFYDDGSYGWAYLDDGALEERRAIEGPAHYLVGLEDATLHVSGTVDGKVLVYSAQRIVIEDDLRYASPRHAEHADDFIGLVAESDVEIAEPSVTGTGDLEIDASIYARRRFAVRNYRSSPSGTLKIYGSVTAGSITATEPRFATQIDFDPRLTKARPPSFPLTDRYELESWDGEWRVEEPDVAAN